MGGTASKSGNTYTFTLPLAKVASGSARLTLSKTALVFFTVNMTLDFTMVNNALTAVIYHNGSILGETGEYVLNNISTYK